MADLEKSALEYIQLNIDRAFELASRTTNGFGGDWVAFYAATRCLEIISEASRRLSPELIARHPDIEWQVVRAAGNVYRHEYQFLLEDRIWETIQYSLPKLKPVIAIELSKLA